MYEEVVVVGGGGSGGGSVWWYEDPKLGPRNSAILDRGNYSRAGPQ